MKSNLKSAKLSGFHLTCKISTDFEGRISKDFVSNVAGFVMALGVRHADSTTGLTPFRLDNDTQFCILSVLGGLSFRVC